MLCAASWLRGFLLTPTASRNGDSVDGAGASGSHCMKASRVKASLSECAARLAALVPADRLDSSVVKWAEKASPHVPWSVAFSGGADSLALLLLLWAHWPERRRTLRVLHFDHRLRGAESTEDARFCARVCGELG